MSDRDFLLGEDKHYSCHDDPEIWKLSREGGLIAAGFVILSPMFAIDDFIAESFISQKAFVQPSGQQCPNAAVQDEIELKHFFHATLPPTAVPDVLGAIPRGLRFPASRSRSPSSNRARREVATHEVAAFARQREDDLAAAACMGTKGEGLE